MTRTELFDKLTKLGVVLHSCNREEQPPQDAEIAKMHYSSYEELVDLYLYELKHNHELTIEKNKNEEDKTMTICSNYFYGNEVSDYGKENGYVDYRTLAKAFDAVLNNDIMSRTIDIGYWEQESGFIDNSEQINEIDDKIENLTDEIDSIAESLEEPEALSNEDIRIFEAEKEAKGNERDKLFEKKEELKTEQEEQPEVFQWYIVSDSGAEILKECNEIVYRNDELDINLWGVTHWGTSWDYVLTDIRIVKED